MIIAVRMKNDVATLDNSLAVPYKLNTLLLYYPAISFFSIYPKELEMFVHAKPTHWFIAI